MDRKIPTSSKLKMYTALVRPVTMHGAETRVLRKREQQLDRIELRILRRISGISLRAGSYRRPHQDGIPTPGRRKTTS